MSKPTLFIDRDGSIRIEVVAFPSPEPPQYWKIAELNPIPVGAMLHGDAVSYVPCRTRTYRRVRDISAIYVYEELYEDVA